MAIKIEEKDGVQVLRINGAMDQYTLTILDENVKDLMKRKGSRFFVLNMVDVTDISSSGVGRILTIYKDLESKEGKLVLADLSAVVEYVLDLARLADILPAYRDEADAIAACRP